MRRVYKKSKICPLTHSPSLSLSFSFARSLQHPDSEKPTCVWEEGCLPGRFEREGKDGCDDCGEPFARAPKHICWKVFRQDACTCFYQGFKLPFFSQDVGFFLSLLFGREGGFKNSTPFTHPPPVFVQQKRWVQFLASFFPFTLLSPILSGTETGQWERDLPSGRFAKANLPGWRGWHLHTRCTAELLMALQQTLLYLRRATKSCTTCAIIAQENQEKL